MLRWRRGRFSGRWRDSLTTAGLAHRPPTGSARPRSLQRHRRSLQRHRRRTGAVMGELLDRAFTEQRLLDAWQEVRDAALADGEGGPEVDRFEAVAARHVSE